MQIAHDEPLVSPLADVLSELLGPRAWSTLGTGLVLPPLSSTAPAGSFDGTDVALALAWYLFDDLCERVPHARAYACECAVAGRAIRFDHGAMRTVAVPSGALPAGRAAIARILEPLGYREQAVYPLDRLGMTGYSYAHAERPEDLPQYFVSELHPERFSPAFAGRVEALVATTVDPLSGWARAQLERLARGAHLDRGELLRLVPALAGCFDRHHREPTLEEYEAFAAESDEMAWISTEGHSFNHVTDRVEDLEAVVAAQRELGRPVKDVVEISASGRIRQSALRAAEVERVFDVGGRFVTRRVPGSFLEFISRAATPTGELDLAFDASNAQGIFGMTGTRP